MYNHLVSPATVPARIGRFEVRSLLGTGGFGTVYRAHDPLLGREVAVKVAHPGLVENPTQRERFLREGRAAARLRHPHLVAVYDAGCEDGTYYMAAAFVEGQTLAKAHKQGELDLRQSVEVVRQLAEALAYAHRQGIVHRDVKPANVLLDARNQAHLTDFGIAHQQGSAEKLTHDGAILGTPAYMAPEQAAGRQGDPLPASDQYSLGAVLYELLTGQPPFSGSPVAILHGVLHEEPPVPRKRNAAVPRDLERVCLKAMVKRPEDRYADCRAFADDLRRWLEGDPVKARPLGLPERIWRWGKREPKLAVAGAVAALALLAAVLVPAVAAILLANEDAANRAKAAELTEESRKAEQAKADAEKRRKEADANRKGAAEAARKSDEEARKAEAERKKAEQVAAKAKEATQRALASTRAVPRFQYVADIQLAQYDLEASDEHKLKERLDPYRTDPSKRDLRGFEWRHLLHTNHVLPLSLPRPEGLLMFVACRDDNRSLTQVFVVPAKEGKSQLRVRAWNLTRRVETAGATIDSYGFLLNPLSFLAPDGRYMIRKSGAAELEVWDLKENKVHRLLKGHSRTTKAASFSHNGARLATLHVDDAVRVWDVGERKVLLRLPADKVRALALAPDGGTLAVIVGAETVIFKVPEGTRLAALPYRKSLDGASAVLAFTPDGKRLAASTGEEVKVWETAGWQELATLPAVFISELRFFADGRTLLTVGPNPNPVRLWDITDKKMPNKFGSVHGRAGAALSPDGKLLALNNRDAIALWDPASGERRLSVPLSHKDAAGLAFTPDGKELLVVFDDGKVEAWPRPLLERATTLGKPGERVASLAFAPKGELAVAAGDAVTWWQLTKGQPATTVPPPAYTVVWTVSADGGSAAAATKEGVFLAHPGDKEFAAFWQGSEARCLAVSRDSKLLAAGLATGEVNVWERPTKKSRLTGKGHKTAVRALAFTADGARLATADAEQVLLWDLVSGKPSPLPAAKVVSLCFVPDGKTLCTGDEGGTIVLWDLEGKKEPVTMKGAHRGAVRAVVCSADGRTVASGGEDGAVRLWEAVTGGELLTFTGRKSGGVTALAFAADDTALAAGHANGDIHLWYALPEQPAEQSLPPPAKPGIK